MKTKDIVITLGGALFAWMFYEQWWGINFALFSLYIIGCLALLFPASTKNTNWWLALATVLISAGCMAWYGNVLCFFSTLFSWLLFSAYTFRPNSPAVLNIVQAGFSVPLSVPRFFKRINAGRLRKTNKHVLITNNILVYVAILAVFFIFLVLYANASKAFSEQLDKIDLNFISFGWLFFAGIGFFLTHSLVKHSRLKMLDREEKKWSRPLTPGVGIHTVITDRIKLENYAGTLLLVLLNLLLLAVNASDIVFLAQGQESFEPGEYHKLVHQGVGALIISIILAVIILLFFFRGNLNFYSGANKLQALAYVWMAQNLILIITAGIKNGIYINEFDGLTHKRIGVFYYLLLSAIGLFFTAVKLYAKKPNWYLVKVNFTAFFIVMIASCPIDWDAVIMKYNFQHAASKNEDPDILYLSTFAPQSISPVAEWVVERTNNPNIPHAYNEDVFALISQRVKDSYQQLKARHESGKWPSYSYKSYTTYQQLSEMPIDSLLTEERLQMLRDYRQAEAAMRAADSTWHADSLRKINNK